MRLINAIGTFSYRVCIRPQCTKLPIGVLKGRLKNEGSETQVTYCEDDLAYAKTYLREQFGNRFIETDFFTDTRPWFKQRQKEELDARLREFDEIGKQYMDRAIKDEQTSRSRNREA